VADIVELQNTNRSLQAVNELAASLSGRQSPPREEGWTRHQENAAKPPLLERTGWSLTGNYFCEWPPRLRRFGDFAAFSYWLRPPRPTA